MNDKLRLDEVIGAWHEQPGPCNEADQGLQSSKNTSQVDQAIQKAAKRFVKTLSPRPTRQAKITTFFEHGHWWLRVYDSGQDDDYLERTFNVVDAEGSNAFDGFGFEKID